MWWQECPHNVVAGMSPWQVEWFLRIVGNGDEGLRLRNRDTPTPMFLVAGMSLSMCPDYRQ